MTAPDPTDVGLALAVIVLAAGKGSRLRSKLPKPLHHAAGRPLIEHVLRATSTLRPAQTIVVTGHGADEVEAHLETLGDLSTGELVTIRQADQLGTAHAVGLALPALDPSIQAAVVVYADTPLWQPDTLAALIQAHVRASALIGLVTCDANDPTGYGRIVRDEQGQVTAIIEEKDATAEQRAINEINAGLYVFDSRWLRQALPHVGRSAGGEYYLPDILPLAVSAAANSQYWPVIAISASLGESLGVNDRIQLAQAEAELRDRARRRLMLAGVTIIDPGSTFIDDTVEVGSDTTIYPFTTIAGQTVIGSDCHIGPQAIINSSRIADRCRVLASMLEESVMEADSDIGPYSHLRPGAHVGPNVHIGNFAEVKNSRVGAHAAIGHMSYIGDSLIGERVNIGAGVITVNMDAFHQKHRTTIGDDAFIGCDTLLISPVTVATDAATGAGAVVNRDVPSGMIAVGVPARNRTRKQRPT